jgi:hypothetical protein
MLITTLMRITDILGRRKIMTKNLDIRKLILNSNVNTPIALKMKEAAEKK